MVMEDGEVDFSNNEIFTDLPDESFFDDVFNDSHICTHTHMCNPPGPDSSHTHTCYHVHTKIVSAMAADDDTVESADKKGKKRPLGNREAVRKYREKKKARVASLEEQVVTLTAENQQLKCLLAYYRGRSEGEIGASFYQNLQPVNHNIGNPNLTCGYVMNPCNMQCGNQVHCLHPEVDGNNGENVSIRDPVMISGCEFENIHCLGNQNSLLNEFPGCTTDQDGFFVANQYRHIAQ